MLALLISGKVAYALVGPSHHHPISVEQVVARPTALLAVHVRHFLYYELPKLSHVCLLLHQHSTVFAVLCAAQHRAPP